MQTSNREFAWEQGRSDGVTKLRLPAKVMLWRESVMPSSVSIYFSKAFADCPDRFPTVQHSAYAVEADKISDAKIIVRTKPPFASQI